VLSITRKKRNVFSSLFCRIYFSIPSFANFIPGEQGCNEGGKVATIPWGLNYYGGVISLRGAPKRPNNVTSASLNTLYLLPKDPRFEYGGAKFASCPGRHPTSLRPCGRRSLAYRFPPTTSPRAKWITGVLCLYCAKPLISCGCTTTVRFA